MNESTDSLIHKAYSLSNLKSNFVIFFLIGKDKIKSNSRINLIFSHFSLLHQVEMCWDLFISNCHCLQFLWLTLPRSCFFYEANSWTPF